MFVYMLCFVVMETELLEYTSLMPMASDFQTKSLQNDSVFYRVASNFQSK